MPGHAPVVNGAEDSTGLDGVVAQLTALAGGMQKQAQERYRPRIPWTACHPVGPQGAIALTAGAGTFLQPDILGPTTMYWWDLRKLSCWGFTAGTVTAVKNSINGETIAAFPSAGNFTWSTQELLAPDDNVILIAAGITGSVQFSLRAIEIETAWLPEYLV
jgi:hypothetical protein